MAQTTEEVLVCEYCSVNCTQVLTRDAKGETKHCSECHQECWRPWAYPPVKPQLVRCG